MSWRVVRPAAWLLSCLGLCSLLLPDPAHACGGLFCNSAQPVNQAAERILFVENGDGTVTAVIEIQYEGPSEKFSWVLPVPGSPDVAISSTTAFDRLQTATNPQYTLQTTFADGCSRSVGIDGGVANTASKSAEEGTAPPVTVLAQGTVGPFDYQTISVDPNLPEPADAAVMWLENEGYDVTALGPEVLGPYLASGLNLIAFRLSKTSMTGSIRPIVITYESDRPFIPIRPTAVAANDDMGVLVWVGGKARAIPSNYKALELNEARINWFMPGATYDDVVSAAADEAGGQGFVTELAEPSGSLQHTIVSGFESDEWDQIANAQFAEGVDLLNKAAPLLGSWDGFADAVASVATLPDGVSVDDLIACSACYRDDPALVLDPEMLRNALYKLVYKPMADTEKLLTSRSYITRLYTTMSADEMTLDPAFDFNSGLTDVSNLHTAKQIIECDDTFHVELPQGDVVYGTKPGVWPMAAMAEQPAARKIMELSTTGQGKVVKDNGDRIAELLAASASAAGDDTATLLNSGDAGTPRGDAGAKLIGGGDGGCRVAPAQNGAGAAWQDALLSLLALAAVRRRRGRGGRAG